MQVFLRLLLVLSNRAVLYPLLKHGGFRTGTFDNEHLYKFLGVKMIELEGVGYRIGKNWLVRDINITIEKGMLWGFVGPNGAGKSTLLRLISGELLPTTGEIRLLGKPIHSYAPQKLARLRAYLQQKRDINFPFTSLEIVLFGRHPYLNGTKETTADLLIAKEALRQVEAQMFTERLYPTLSGGEASRVDVARILTQAPDLFLLDEPTNHLDPRHQVQILNLCKTICGHGKTAITAIHDLNLASMYTDHLLLLKEGISVACGTPEAVLTLDLLSETYGIPFEVLPHPNGYPWVMPSLNPS